MPHKEVLSGLKKVSSVINKGRRAGGVQAQKLQNVFEGQVLRRIGIGPIGTFDDEAKSVTASKFKSASSTIVRPPVTKGFQTAHLQKVQRQGSSAQSATAKMQMRKLGQRLKGKVDF